MQNLEKIDAILAKFESTQKAKYAQRAYKRVTALISKHFSFEVPCPCPCCTDEHCCAPEGICECADACGCLASPEEGCNCTSGPTTEFVTDFDLATLYLTAARACHAMRESVLNGLSEEQVFNQVIGMMGQKYLDQHEHDEDEEVCEGCCDGKCEEGCKCEHAAEEGDEEEYEYDESEVDEEELEASLAFAEAHDYDTDASEYLHQAMDCLAAVLAEDIVEPEVMHASARHYLDIANLLSACEGDHSVALQLCLRRALTHATTAIRLNPDMAYIELLEIQAAAALGLYNLDMGEEDEECEDECCCCDDCGEVCESCSCSECCKENEESEDSVNSENVGEVETVKVEKEDSEEAAAEEAAEEAEASSEDVFNACCCGACEGACECPSDCSDCECECEQLLSSLVDENFQRHPLLEMAREVSAVIYRDRAGMLELASDDYAELLALARQQLSECSFFAFSKKAAIRAKVSEYESMLETCQVYMEQDELQNEEDEDEEIESEEVQAEAN